jgi:hypothetical protein
MPEYLPDTSMADIASPKMPANKQDHLIWSTPDKVAVLVLIEIN